LGFLKRAGEVIGDDIAQRIERLVAGLVGENRYDHAPSVSETRWRARRRTPQPERYG
jgi:hypothetical protein